MEARVYYRRLSNDNLIPRTVGKKCWTPDEMILFAEMYHSMEMGNGNLARISHRFHIDDPVIEIASLRIRDNLICANPLTKPEVVDRELRGYLTELLNSLNGE